MRKKTFLMWLLLLPTHAMAEVSVTISQQGHYTMIHVSHETLASVLKYYHRHYNTTSTLPAAMATDKINADAKGESLTAATLRLLHLYNVGLVADKHNGLSRITILPTANVPDNGQTMDIGRINLNEVQRYRRMIQRLHSRRNRFSGRHSSQTQSVRNHRLSNALRRPLRGGYAHPVGRQSSKPSVYNEAEQYEQMRRARARYHRQHL